MEIKDVKKDKKKVLNLDYIRDKDRQPVKGMFKFHEVPGGQMSFSIKLYKGDQVETYNMKDGEILSIPLGVAKHLNKNGWYPEYSYVQGEDMKNIAQVTKKIRRFSFNSLEFMDIDDLNDNDSVASAPAGI